MQAAATRMAKEIRMLQADPPPGVWAAPRGDSLTQLEAQLQGPAGTVYEGGLFNLSVDIPARYPFEPPKVKFATKIYHPNIDPEGRICLDLLNMPPKGAWKPSLNVGTLLASIGLLLAEPNPEDGLVTDVTAEYKHQRQVFDAKARQWTQRYAVQQLQQPQQGSGPASPAAEGPAAAEAVHGRPQEGQVPPAAHAGDAEGGKENLQAPSSAGAGKQLGGAATAATDAAAAAGNAAPPAPPAVAAPAAAAAAAAPQQQPAKRPRLALRK